MKIQKYGMYYPSEYSSGNEARIMNLVSIYTKPSLAPIVRRYYATQYYSIIITEKMDISLQNLFHLIYKKPNWEGVYDQVSRIVLINLMKLHQNGIVHGDCHSGNIMFVLVSGRISVEKNKWMGNPSTFLDGLNEGRILMKFIDFGMATTEYEIKRNPEKIWGFYVNIELPKRLKEIGCIQDENVPKNLFGILKFYDIVQLFQSFSHESQYFENPFYINTENTVIRDLKIKEQELKGSSGCIVGKLYTK